jgi:hypothetical protein
VIRGGASGRASRRGRSATRLRHPTTGQAGKETGVHPYPHRLAVEPALAATLLLRGFTFWLPMLPGLWLARRELRGRGGQEAGRGDGSSSDDANPGGDTP